MKKYLIPFITVLLILGISLDASAGRKVFREGIIVNEQSADSDSRFESDANTHMLFVDAGGNCIGINESACDEMLHLTSATSQKPEAKLENTTGDAESAILGIYKNRSGAVLTDGDAMGAIEFNGMNSTPTDNRSAQISAFMNDSTAGQEDGRLRFRVDMQGTERNFLDLNSVEAGQAIIVLNEDGQDVDTRIEASGAANALFVEGSSGNVGIGDGSPSATMTFADGSTIGTSTTATTFTLEGDGDLFLASGNVFGAGITPGGRNSVSIDLENGIGFPATAVASSDVNVLDDYEEGTYNPTLTCSTSGSFGLATGADTLAYTKIGQLVAIQGRIQITSDSSCSGQLRLSIPFDAAPGTEFSYLVSPSIVIRDHGDAELENPYLQGEGNQAYMALANVTDAGTVENIDETRVDDAFYIQVSFNYITDVFG